MNCKNFSEEEEKKRAKITMNSRGKEAKKYRRN